MSQKIDQPFIPGGLSDETKADYLRQAADDLLPVESRRAAAVALAFSRDLPPELEFLLDDSEDSSEARPERPIAGVNPNRKSSQPIPGLEHVPAWGEMVHVRGSEVKQEQLEWLYPNRFPIGKLSVIAGDQGLGKSQLSLALAAHVTTGEPWPDFPHEPQKTGSAIFVTAEDDLADTIAPRAAASGCDLQQVIFSTTVRKRDGKLEPFCVWRDVPPLDDLLAKIGNVRLLVIDPILDFMMGIKANDCDVRYALRPLRDIARKYRIAVVMIHHLNKDQGLKALYRVANAGAFTQVARMCWLLSEHPFDAARRVLVPLKANLAAKQPGVCIRMGDGRVEIESEHVDWDADEVMRLLHDARYRQEGEGKRGPRGIMKRLMGLIEKRLSSEPAPLADLRRDLKQEGFKDGVFYKAIHRLKELEKVEAYLSPEQVDMLRRMPSKVGRDVPLLNVRGGGSDPSAN